MSPEQARAKDIGSMAAADIFSLGVVFYELLTGRRPFRADIAGGNAGADHSYEATPAPRSLMTASPRNWNASA